MPSLLSRYIAGDHKAVWREIDSTDADDAEAVMRETFTRVSRNIDRLIVRLADTGYRFECEAGRDTPPQPPRSPVDPAPIALRVAELFPDHPSPWPHTLTLAADLIGNVDLRQRFPAESSPEDDVAMMAQAEAALQAHAQNPAIRHLLETLKDNAPDTQDDRRQALWDADSDPHPHADDPVIARLGDWDPLEISFDYLAYCLTDDDLDAAGTPPGGPVAPEFAADYLHKANYSGGCGPRIPLPSENRDVTVHLDGATTTLSAYLRHACRNGGFLGVPSPVMSGDTALRPAGLGRLTLPEHPVFATLSADLEPI